MTALMWRGERLDTLGDLMHAVRAIYDLPVGEREGVAQEFKKAYRAVNEHADENIGYLSGYFSFSDMPEVMRLFAVEHPVFGGPDKPIAPQDAFAAGETLMKGRDTA